MPSSGIVRIAVRSAATAAFLNVVAIVIITIFY
jgi:hypothetical protein